MFLFCFWPGQNFFHPWELKALGNKRTLHILCNLISWGLHSGHALTEAENNFLCSHSSHCLDQNCVPSKHASREFVLLNQRQYLPCWDEQENMAVGIMSRYVEVLLGEAWKESVLPEMKAYCTSSLSFKIQGSVKPHGLLEATKGNQGKT